MAELNNISAGKRFQDAIAGEKSFAQRSTENISAQDAIAGEKSFAQESTENISVQDAIAGEKSFAQESTENISVQDAMAGTQSINQHETKLKPTGIFVLDRNLGGGLPERSLIYFSANPRSMSEVFLYQFTQARKTYYFSTNRRPKYIQNNISNLNFDISNITYVDVYSEYYLTSFGEMIDTVGNEYVDAKIIEFTEYNLKNILNESANEDINIIIDNFSFYMNLNVNLGMLKRLTNILYETTKEIDCMTYLYGLKGSHPENVENDLLNSADVIFDVEIERTADKMTSMLAIPKIRGMVPKAEMIKFKVGEGVQIDTSRDIA